MTDVFLEKLHVVLTVRQLAHETHLRGEQVKALDSLTESYLTALLAPYIQEVQP